MMVMVMMMMMMTNMLLVLMVEALILLIPSADDCDSCKTHKQDFAGFLPRRVVAPGQPVAKILPDVAQRTGLPPSCVVCGGTTGEDNPPLPLLACTGRSL